MKSLTQYISEAREVIGELPFTRSQVRSFLRAVSNFDDSSLPWKSIEKMVTKKYGEKVWRGFLGWCEGTQYGSDYNDMYDILCNIPITRLGSILGAGSDGVALQLSGGRVCKLFHKNTPMDKYSRKFYEYCAKNDSTVFPKVYKLASNYVIMEMLELHTKRCKLWDKYLGYNGVKVGGTLIEELAKQYIENPDANLNLERLSSDEREVFDWTVQALTELKVAVGWDSLSDMKLDNIGERKDGTIIWFDI